MNARGVDVYISIGTPNVYQYFIFKSLEFRVFGFTLFFFFFSLNFNNDSNYDDQKIERLLFHPSLSLSLFFPLNESIDQ